MGKGTVPLICTGIPELPGCGARFNGPPGQYICPICASESFQTADVHVRILERGRSEDTVEELWPFMEQRFKGPIQGWRNSGADFGLLVSPNRAVHITICPLFLPSRDQFADAMWAVADFANENEARTIGWMPLGELTPETVGIFERTKYEIMES